LLGGNSQRTRTREGVRVFSGKPSGLFATRRVNEAEGRVSGREAKPPVESPQLHPIKSGLRAAFLLGGNRAKRHFYSAFRTRVRADVCSGGR